MLALLKQWEKDFGISYYTTEAYNSIQNGVVERSIQTSEEHVRAMLEDSNMPVEFWLEALDACTVMRNALPNRPGVDGFKVSPNEAFTGKRPSALHFRVWGCKAVVYIDAKSQLARMRSDKLMNRGKDAVFIGYVPDTSKMWQFWEPDMRDIRTHNNAVWFENEKGGDMTLNVPRLNQPSQAPLRNPVGRPARKETPDLKPLQVQLPPPPEDIGQYQVMVEPPPGGGDSQDPEEENRKRENHPPGG